MQVYDSAERRIPVISQLQEIYRNRGLLKLLIIRDLTVRYKRSVLGVGWSLLNPILTTTVMFYVFNTVFMRGLQNRETFLPYLFAGVLLSTFFNQGVNFAADAVAGGAGLLNKVYVRPEIFALSGTISSAINFIFGLVPLTLVVYSMHHSLGIRALLIIPIIFFMILLTTGLGLLFAIAYLEFDDARHLIQVMLMLLTYMTPVFYSLSALGPNTQRVISKNPLTSFLNVLRENWGNTFNGTIHDWLYLASFSTFIFVISFYLFAKWWPKGVTKL
jgi:ABC-type polysaccharide/polyol phosphate export permease